METVDVTRERSLRPQVRQLYREAFPREERIPWWLLQLNARRRGVDLTAWVEDGRLCAMTASVTTEEMHFLLFFAVTPEKRGQGIGSKILQTLQTQHPQVVLNVEPLTEDAPNYDQRLHRFAFYGRNGLYDTGWHVWEVGGMFRVLSTKKQLDVPAYKAIFKKLSLGLWDVTLKEAN